MALPGERLFMRTGTREGASHAFESKQLFILYVPAEVDIRMGKRERGGGA